jgi:hypothetical protein
MVLPNPLTSHANLAGVMGVEHVRYEGRLGVKRRRWTTGEIISDAYGHVCRLYARIRCFMGPIWHLVGPWKCTRRWLGSWCSSGLSTDMLVVLTPAPPIGPGTQIWSRYARASSPTPGRLLMAQPRAPAGRRAHATNTAVPLFFSVSDSAQDPQPNAWWILAVCLSVSQ